VNRASTEEQEALYAALGIERSAWRKHERALRAAAAFAEANREQENGDPRGSSRT
jgi:hypothetical protein